MVEYLNKNEEKIKQLNAFMKDLKKDISKEEKRKVYNHYEPFIKQITPTDLFYLESYAHNTKASIKTIKETANKFVNAFYAPLKTYEITDHNHPFMKGLLEENQAIITHLKAIKAILKKALSLTIFAR